MTQKGFSAIAILIVGIILAVGAGGYFLFKKPVEPSIQGKETDYQYGFINRDGSFGRSPAAQDSKLVRINKLTNKKELVLASIDELEKIFNQIGSGVARAHGSPIIHIFNQPEYAGKLIFANPFKLYYFDSRTRAVQELKNANKALNGVSPETGPIEDAIVFSPDRTKIAFSKYSDAGSLYVVNLLNDSYKRYELLSEPFTLDTSKYPGGIFLQDISFANDNLIKYGVFRNDLPGQLVEYRYLRD